MGLRETINVFICPHDVPEIRKSRADRPLTRRPRRRPPILIAGRGLMDNLWDHFIFFLYLSIEEENKMKNLLSFEMRR
jgi:hypothetical protein